MHNGMRNQNLPQLADAAETSPRYDPPGVPYVGLCQGKEPGRARGPGETKGLARRTN